MPDSGQNVGDLKSVTTFDAHWLLRHTHAHTISSLSQRNTNTGARPPYDAIKPTRTRQHSVTIKAKCPCYIGWMICDLKTFFGTLRDPECLHFSFRRECAGPFCYPNILNVLTGVLLYFVRSLCRFGEWLGWCKKIADGAYASVNNNLTEFV